MPTTLEQYRRAFSGNETPLRLFARAAGIDCMTWMRLEEHFGKINFDPKHTPRIQLERVAAMFSAIGCEHCDISPFFVWQIFPDAPLDPMFPPLGRRIPVNGSWLQEHRAASRAKLAMASGISADVVKRVENAQGETPVTFRSILKLVNGINAISLQRGYPPTPAGAIFPEIFEPFADRAYPTLHPNTPTE